MADLKITDDVKEAMLEMLVELPNITAVCKIFGVNPTTMRRHRKKDSDFDAKVKEALEDGYDGFEAEAIRRGVQGIKEPVFFQGMEVGEVTKYSDNLLMLLLKGRKSKVYGNKNTEEGQNVTLNFNLGEK